MEAKINFRREEVTEIGRREFERQFGKVPDGHDLSAHVNYGELIVEVYPHREPMPAAPVQEDTVATA